MARYLGALDIVEHLQRSLPIGSFAIGYFSRYREYSYYTFESFGDLVELLKDRDPTGFELYPEGSRRIDFSIDQWLIFADEERARRTLEALKIAFPEEPDDSE